MLRSLTRLLQNALQCGQRQPGTSFAGGRARARQLRQPHHVQAGRIAMQHLQPERPHRLGRPEFPLTPRMPHLVACLHDRRGDELVSDVALDSRDRQDNTCRHGRASGWGVCAHTNHSDRRLGHLSLPAPSRRHASETNQWNQQELSLKLMPFTPVLFIYFQKKQQVGARTLNRHSPPGR